MKPVASLDSADRYDEIRRTILAKPGLKDFYLSAYHRFAQCLQQSPAKGMVVEVGSGAGFIKEVLPEVITTDFLPYHGVDRQLDATAMSTPDQSLRAIFLLDVFHHIPDVARFLHEVERCLVPGGRLLMVEPYPGWVGKLFYRYLHHERYEPQSPTWQFETSGPLSGANSTLPWIVFERDRKKFEREFPRLRIARFEVHTPLQYWLAGGLKRWTLIPRWACAAIKRFDRALCLMLPRVGSFVDIEIVRTDR